MSEFVKRVLATGALHFVGGVMGNKKMVRAGREKQRLVFMDATDEDLNELVQTDLSRNPELIADDLLNVYKSVREAAQNPEVWRKRYEEDDMA